MNRLRLIAAGALAVAVGAAASLSAAQEKIKVGIVGQFSGPFALSGKQFRQGIEVFQAIHGTKVGDREVEIVYRDVGGPNPANAKRQAEELIVREKAAILGGFYLTPDALAAASVLNETKTPGVIFVSASPLVLRQSQYFIRVGSGAWQTGFPAAEWAIKQNKKRAYIVVSDFAPGHDSQEAFRTQFTKLGGTVLGEDRMPLNTVDYAPFVERIAGAKPDVVHVFIPNGAPAVNFIKAVAARDLLKSTVFIGVGESDDPDLPSLGEASLGYHSTLYYTLTLKNDENSQFVAKHTEKFKGDLPNFAMITAYDGMRVIYRMIESQKGKPFDGTAAVEAVKGFAWNSPRGPVSIDPATRAIVQNIYIRKVVKEEGRLINVVVDTFPAFKDPWTEPKR
jgi:branched-chain amino acid transport system substrate-binding protein